MGRAGGQELEGRFTKWNNNAGGVRAHEQATKPSTTSPPPSTQPAPSSTPVTLADLGLGGEAAKAVQSDTRNLSARDVAASRQAESEGSAWWRRSGGRLGVIGEASDSSDEADGADGGDRPWPSGDSDEDEDEEAGAGDVPQCFSHFSYEATEGRQLVCDLQVLL